MHEELGPSSLAPEALRSRARTMGLVLALSVLLLAVKGAAFAVTGSRALLSDALESIINVVTGAFALYSVLLAARPPDRSHPYGHGKIEYFAAALEGSMILLAAAAILRESLPHVFDPQPVRSLELGLLLAASAGLLNGLTGLFLLRRSRRVHSAAMAGEGRHLLADTATTGGVVLGLLLARLTGWLVLDPLIACAVAAWLCWSGVQLLREAASRLMDRSDPEVLEKVAGILEDERRPEWIEAHLLRALRSGPFVRVDVHLTFPRFWSVERVHASQHDLLGLLIRRLQQPGEVLVHVDPCRPGVCAECAFAPCALRSEAFRGFRTWSPAVLQSGPAGLDEDGCQTIQATASREVTAE